MRYKSTGTPKQHKHTDTLRVTPDPELEHVDLSHMVDRVEVARPAGRPARVPGADITALPNVRITVDERRRYDAVCRTLQCSLSELVRAALDEYCSRCERDR